ncbi:MAG: response regulator [Pseudomonadota bacterium]|uniref:Response regulator n=1 Tax=Candidatus Desulfatibia profunda TaxID=2841695 RepID=A0A8J6NN84_9BACT|nr:response regulator [Candidatus Desulfatibia profunda]MBL7180391.1 response regulator [Desulfobacterales bacterium]
MASILIVDDHPHVRKLVSKGLAAEGYRITAIDDAALTWEHIQALAPDLVLLNCLSERFDSFALLVDIKSRYPKYPVLVYVIQHVDAMVSLKQAITGVLDEIQLPN